MLPFITITISIEDTFLTLTRTMRNKITGRSQMACFDLIQRVLFRQQTSNIWILMVTIYGIPWELNGDRN